MCLVFSLARNFNFDSKNLVKSLPARIDLVFVDITIITCQIRNNYMEEVLYINFRNYVSITRQLHVKISKEKVRFGYVKEKEKRSC